MIETAAKNGAIVGAALASIYEDESLAFRNLFELATRYVAARAHGHTTAELHAWREAYEQAGQTAYRAQAVPAEDSAPSSGSKPWNLPKAPTPAPIPAFVALVEDAK